MKFIMNEFKQGGIFDPFPKAYRKLRARSLRWDVDFATVTVAKHPYSQDGRHVAIMAAGFHLPGTVHAIKMLSNPKSFERHPLGGVVEVKMSEARWYERIEKAEASWDTQPYDLSELIEALAGLKALANLSLVRPESRKRTAQDPAEGERFLGELPLTLEEVESLIALAKSLDSPLKPKSAQED